MMSHISSTVILVSLFAAVVTALPTLVNRRSSEYEVLIKRLKRSRRDDSCEDHPNCGKWLDFNDLYWSCRNSKHRKQCRKTCKLCPTPSPQTTTTMTSPTTTTSPVIITTDGCFDANEHCAQWAQSGYCTINPGYMLDKCPLSCGACVNTTSTATVSTTLATDCVDIMPQPCPGWIHDCLTNPSVQLYCKKTCNLCITSPPTAISTVSTMATSTPTTPTTPATTTTTTPATIATTTKPPTTTTTTTKPSTTPYDTTTTKKALTNQSTRSTTPWIISDVSTVPKRSTKQLFNPTTIPGIPLTSGIVYTTTKGFTGMTLENIPSAGPRQVKSRLNKAVVGIVVSGILLIACVVIAVCLYKRRKRKRNALMASTPGSIITMQPFNYSKSHDTTRDSGIVDCDVYEELSSPKANQPFYHVLEDSSERASSPQRLEPIYACASNEHDNAASHPERPIIYDYSIPEGLMTSSLVPKNLRPCGAGKVLNNVAMETPYYHVLENSNAVAPETYQELPVIYEPLIGGNTNQSAGETPLAQSGYQPIKREKSVYESLDNSNRIRN